MTMSTLPDASRSLVVFASRRGRAREAADLDREALEALLEGVEMLAREEGGRRDQRDL